ncbi:MAG: YibE/F family protein [Trueperaceae bacterium]|nr:YibE/F family protein [Trueperaceae bacterium]
MSTLPGSLRRTPLCLFLGLLVLLGLLGGALAQSSPGDQPFGYLEGRILDIGSEGRRAIVETQSGDTIEAEIGLPLSEDMGGAELPSFREGQRVELYYSPAPDGTQQYVVTDWVRRPALYGLVGLFLAVSVLVARGKGLRAFIATGTSLYIAIGFIVPRILDGWNPILVSLLGVGGILILAIYFVHGVNWSTTAAMIGTFVAVIVTMGLGLLFTELAYLTGFGSEEAMMINIGASQVNLKGLLLAGLLIGALGALTDITIVQASVVRELAHVNPDFGLRELYTRGMNVGLDHIGSLVNTLVLAYTGAALPLLVLLSINDFTVARALNLELVAAEVVHTLVGSIGLILAVPFTTLVAGLMFRGDTLPMRKGELEHAHHH